MSGSVSHYEERPHWMVRIVLLAAIIAVFFVARGFVGQRSLRTAETPQRVALVGTEPQSPPRVEPERKPAPQEEVVASTDGLGDAGSPGDAGPAPIDDQLGVDSDAEAGSDSFGLRAKPGGRDLGLDLGKPQSARFGNGGSGGSGGFGNYATVLAGELKSWLNSDDELRRSSYQVHVQLWLDPRGAVLHCALADTTGNGALDRRLMNRISTAIAHEPPLDLPQPITVLIRSHGAGRGTS